MFKKQTKNQNTKLGPDIDSKKAMFGPDIDTTAYKCIQLDVYSFGVILGN